MSDSIFLKDLRVRTIVGIWDWERRLPQLRHPVSGATMAELWERFDQASHPIHRVALEL